MSFLDNILGAVTQPMQDLGTGLGTMGQSMGPKRRPQWRPRPDYNPHEMEGFQILSQLASQGVSPEILQMMQADIEGSYGQRMENWTTQNQMRQEGQMNRPMYATQAIEMANAGVPASAIGAAFQGVPGAGGFIENQVVPSLGGGGTPGGALDQTTMESVMAHASDLAMAGTPLHDARIQIMSGMRNTAGTTPAEIEAAYNLIGSVYEPAAPNPGAETFEPGSRAAMLNAPMSFAEYQAQLAAPPPPTMAGPPPPVTQTGLLSPLASGGKFRGI